MSLNRVCQTNKFTLSVGLLTDYVDNMDFDSLTNIHKHTEKVRERERDKTRYMLYPSLSLSISLSRYLFFPYK